MTRRFPLFSLPNLALHHRVFQQFTWDILFELSFCSTKSREAVKKWTNSLSKKQKGVLAVCVFDSYLAASVTTFRDTCTWLVSSTRSTDACNWEKHLESKKINGSELRIGRIVDPATQEFEGYFGCIGNPPHNVFMTLVDYLVEVFNCQVSRVTVDVEFIEDGAILNWKPLREASCFSWYEGSLTPDEMTRIFEMVDEKKDLSITANCAPFEYQKTISVHKFYGSNLSWFSRNHLMNLDCEYSVFYNQMFTYQDYYAFIKQWVEGKNTKLIVFQVSLGEEYIKNTEFVNVNFEKILGDIPSYPGVPKRYDPIFDSPSPGEHYAAGRDIFREDGKMATFLLRNAPYFIEFVVWNKRHPNQWNEYHDFYNLFNI